MIVEDNITGGGEANVFTGEVFLRKPNVLLLCLFFLFLFLPNLLQNKLQLSFSEGCRAACEVGRRANTEGSVREKCR